MLGSGNAARLNFVFDTLLLLSGIFVAAYLGGALQGRPVWMGWLCLWSLTAWVITSSALRHYDPLAFSRGRADDSALFSVQVLAVVSVIEVANLALRHRPGSVSIGVFLLAFWPAGLGLRQLFRKLAAREGPLDEVLIVGVGPIGRITGQDLRKQKKRRLIGYFSFADEGTRDLDLLERTLPGFALQGPAEDLERVLRSTPVSEVYIAGNARKHSAEMQSAIQVCERFGIPFAIPASHFRLDRSRAAGNAVQDGYLHYLTHESKPHQLGLKRLFDIAASAVALWLLFPLLVVVGVAVKLTSRGPMLFRQQRVGLFGHKFNMLKFRSMVVNAEELKARLASQNEQNGPVFKMKQDPRITLVGRFIRKYSIDELPQLINVLRGDMSVVGPRPPVPQEVAKYEVWQLRRLSVRPGLTCIWQVSGRNQISFEKWMYLDLRYIDHWSLWRDFDLIIKTVPVVITGRGAS